MNNIRYYIDWSNRLTYLTATEILRCSKRQCRVHTIEYFVDVAKECINVGNFNSFMAIVAALSLPLIARLKKTVILFQFNLINSYSFHFQFH